MYISFQIWPYLLGHYRWEFGQCSLDETDNKTRTSYENKVSDWMAVEAIVRQRDKEVTAASIAKLSEGGTHNTETHTLQHFTYCTFVVSMSFDNISCGNNSMNLSNEVFESVDEDPMSSRTVSADKVKLNTDCTRTCVHNSISLLSPDFHH